MILEDCPRCGSDSIAWSSDTFMDIVKIRIWCTRCDHSVIVWLRKSDLPMPIEDKVAELWREER